MLHGNSWPGQTSLGAFIISEGLRLVCSDFTILIWEALHLRGPDRKLHGLVLWVRHVFFTGSCSRSYLEGVVRDART